MKVEKENKVQSHNQILQRLVSGKIIAVVRLDSGDELVQVAEALKAGGIEAIEFTVPTRLG